MDTIQKALLELKKGNMVIAIDNRGRENEGDVIMAAEFANPKAINFMITHCRGLVCLALTPTRVKALQLTPMVKTNTTRFHTNFTVSIDAQRKITTGISARDRAETIRVALHPKTKPTDLARPGHIFPLAANPLGVLGRSGHTEAAVDLPRLAQLQPAGVLCEILNKSGDSARGNDLKKFAKRHHLHTIFIDDLISFRKAHNI